MSEEAKAAARERLTAYLDSARMRKTPERFTILNAAYDFDGCFTLSELDARLRGEMRFPVSRATLYNAMRLFIRIGLMARHSVHGDTVYEACIDVTGHCRQICVVCGKTCEVKAPGVARAMEDIRLKRFRRKTYMIYVYGVCSSCEARMTRMARKAKSKKKKMPTDE